MLRWINSIRTNICTIHMQRDTGALCAEMMTTITPLYDGIGKLRTHVNVINRRHAAAKRADDWQIDEIPASLYGIMTCTGSSESNEPGGWTRQNAIVHSKVQHSNRYPIWASIFRAYSRPHKCEQIRIISPAAIQSMHQYPKWVNGLDIPT